jgi:hypothetical protein
MPIRSKNRNLCCGCNCCSVACTRRTSACQCLSSAHMRGRSKWLPTGQLPNPTHLPAARDKQRRAPSWRPRPRPHGRARSSRRRAAAASDRRDALPRGGAPPSPPLQSRFAAAAAGEQRPARWRGSEDEEEGGLPRPPPLLRAAPLALALAAPACSGPSAPPPCPTHLPRRPLHVRALNWSELSCSTISNMGLWPNNKHLRYAALNLSLRVDQLQSFRTGESKY